MKTLRCLGLDGSEHVCEYILEHMDGEFVLIFKQLDRALASIAGVIEILTSIVLQGELRGVDPTRLRVFDFHPPRMNPLDVWQEVKFSSAYVVEPDKSLLQQMAERVVGRVPDHYWVVEMPFWSRVDEKLQDRLSVIHPTLLLASSQVEELISLPETTVTITTKLTDAEAMALARFMKRIGFLEWRRNSVDNREAYLMRDGCEKIARTLANQGYDAPE